MLDEQRPTTVSEARACRICGYNLYTLPRNGRCPECGVPIFRALGQPGPGRYGSVALRGLMMGSVGIILSTGMAATAFVGWIPLLLLGRGGPHQVVAGGFLAVVAGQVLVGIGLGTYAWFAVRDVRNHIPFPVMPQLFIGLIGHTVAALIGALGFLSSIEGQGWLTGFGLAGLVGIVRHGPMRQLLSTAMGSRPELAPPLDELAEGVFFGAIVVAFVLALGGIDNRFLAYIAGLALLFWFTRALMNSINAIGILAIAFRARREAEVADQQADSINAR